MSQDDFVAGPTPVTRLGCLSQPATGASAVPAGTEASKVRDLRWNSLSFEEQLKFALEQHSTAPVRGAVQSEVARTFRIDDADLSLADCSSWSERRNRSDALVESARGRRARVVLLVTRATQTDPYVVSQRTTVVTHAVVGDVGSNPTRSLLEHSSVAAGIQYLANVREKFPRQVIAEGSEPRVAHSGPNFVVEEDYNGFVVANNRSFERLYPEPVVLEAPLEARYVDRQRVRRYMSFKRKRQGEEPGQSSSAANPPASTSAPAHVPLSQASDALSLGFSGASQISFGVSTPFASVPERRGAAGVSSRNELSQME